MFALGRRALCSEPRRRPSAYSRHLRGPARFTPTAVFGRHSLTHRRREPGNLRSACVDLRPASRRDEPGKDRGLLEDIRGVCSARKNPLIGTPSTAIHAGYSSAAADESLLLFDVLVLCSFGGPIILDNSDLFTVCLEGSALRHCSRLACFVRRRTMLYQI